MYSDQLPCGYSDFQSITYGVLAIDPWLLSVHHWNYGQPHRCPKMAQSIPDPHFGEALEPPEDFALRAKGPHKARDQDEVRLRAQKHDKSYGVAIKTLSNAGAQRKRVKCRNVLVACVDVDMIRLPLEKITDNALSSHLARQIGNFSGQVLWAKNCCFFRIFLRRSLFFGGGDQPPARIA